MTSKKRSANTAALDAADEPAAQVASAASAADKEKKQKLNNNAGAPASSPSKHGSAKAATIAAPPAPTASAASGSSSSALNPAAYSAIAAAHSAKFKAYTSETNERAHRILHNVMPKKVLELDHQIQHHAAFAHSISPPFSADGSLLADRASEPIGSNPSVMGLIPLVKSELLSLIEHMGSLKLMIQLRIPSVDDGNNFGVGQSNITMHTQRKCRSDRRRETEREKQMYDGRACECAADPPVVLRLYLAVRRFCLVRDPRGEHQRDRQDRGRGLPLFGQDPELLFEPHSRGESCTHVEAQAEDQQQQPAGMTQPPLTLLFTHSSHVLPLYLLCVLLRIQVAKLSKYPAILDYWQSVRELDESFYTDMRLFLVDMRNSYTTLHDLLLKNEERINNPRGEQGDQEGRNRRHAFA